MVPSASSRFIIRTHPVFQPGSEKVVPRQSVRTHRSGPRNRRHARSQRLCCVHLLQRTASYHRGFISLPLICRRVTFASLSSRSTITRLTTRSATTMFHPSSLFTVERQDFGNQRRRGEATAPEGGDDKGGGRGRRERVLEILRAQHREEFGGDAAGRRVVLPPSH